jgi:hypothetical protein
MSLNIIKEESTPPKTYKVFNINDYVKVKLTEFGKQKYKDYYNQYSVKELKLVEDENGYVQFQLWELMHMFGKHFVLGCDLCFNTDILIEKRYLH